MDTFKAESQKTKIQHTFLNTCSSQKIIYEVSYTPVIRFNVSFSLENDELCLSVTSKFLHQEVSYNLQKYGEKLMADMIAKKISPSPSTITTELVKFVTKNPLLAIREEIFSINKKHQSAKGYTAVLKLKQKSSKLEIEVTVDKFSLVFEIFVPSHYPDVAPEFTKFNSEIHEGIKSSLKKYSEKLFETACSLPETATEKQIDNFQSKTCIAETVNWIVANFIYSVSAECKICNKQALSSDVMRSECGCVFHRNCVTKYYKTPPFNTKGKKCLNCKNKMLIEDQWCEVEKDCSGKARRKEEKARAMKEAEDFLF